MSFKNAQIVQISADQEKYHAQTVARGHKDFVASSSMLRLFAQCPSRWRHGYTSPESEAKRFGSLLDCRLLTPESFQARFSIKPATYPDTKTGEAKPWNGNATFCREWIEEQGDKEICSAAEVAESDAAFRRLRGDEIIAAWIDCSDRQVWLQAEWHDKSGVVVPVKALLDFVPRKDTEFEKCLGDLKCIRSGGLVPFQRQVFQLGWHLQAALYQDMYVAATGEDRNTWCIVGVENYPPFEPIRRMFSQSEGTDIMGIGRQTYQHALKRYCACLKSNKWPGYDDHADSVQGWSIVAAESWMAYEALSEALQESQEEAEEESVDIIP